MNNDPRIGGLYRHKKHFRVIRIEGALPGPQEQWFGGRYADGERCAVRASDLVPLSEQEALRFAPSFERGKLIKGPWGRPDKQPKTAE
jgi:hypothetical protein